MPEKRTLKRAQRDKQAVKAPTTQAGEFIREEMHHVREGKHGARSSKQAIAVGLSKARRAGVKLPPPGPGKAKPKTRQSARRAYAKGQSRPQDKVSGKRARAARGALKREGGEAASRKSLARQAQAAARKRSARARSAAARKASQTKARAKRRAAAQKAARTRYAA